MRNLFFSFMVLSILIASFAGCNKEYVPAQVGDWQTLSTVGFKINYTITETLLCKHITDMPGYMACTDYRMSGDTMFINGPELEVLLWEFDKDCSEIATIHNLSRNGGQPEIFLLKRK